MLKIDFERNASKDWLNGKTTFPHLVVSPRPLDLAEPVYAYGYPLSTYEVEQQPGGTVSFEALSPRVTSAIVASNREYHGPVIDSNDPLHYVLDKALNYGNSGGPIIASETGYVHAMCARFQP